MGEKLHMGKQTKYIFVTGGIKNVSQMPRNSFSFAVIEDRKSVV